MIHKKTQRFAALAAFSLVLLFTALAQAGWVEQDVDGQTMYLSGGKIAVDSGRAAGEQDISSIVDAKAGKFTMINAKNRIYATGTMEEFCTAGLALGNEMQQAILKNLPPEQRAMIEQQMKQMKPPPSPPKWKPRTVSMKAQGKGGVIAGYKTKKYTLMADGKPYLEIWLAQGLSQMKEMKKMGLYSAFRDKKKMGKCMQSADNGAGDSFDPLDVPEYAKLLEKGWIVKEIKHHRGAPGSYMGGATSIREVKSLKQTNIPASKFKPPASYKKVSVKDLYRGFVPAGNMMRR